MRHFLIQCICQTCKIDLICFAHHFLVVTISTNHIAPQALLTGIIQIIDHSCSSVRGVNMSFLNIKDRSDRDKTIKEYLALKKRLKQRNLEERVGYQDYQHDLDKEYEPVVASQGRMTENITGQLVPIKEQLEQLTSLVNRPTL